MTRVYTSGGTSMPLLRSAEVTEDIVSEMIAEHDKANTESVDVIVEKELTPLKESHDPLSVRATDRSVMIGYRSHDGWYAILTYNRQKEEWYTDIIGSPCYFDSSLQYADISHIHTYENKKEFARNEFVEDDGVKWFETNKSNSL